MCCWSIVDHGCQTGRLLKHVPYQGEELSCRSLVELGVESVYDHSMKIARSLSAGKYVGKYLLVLFENDSLDAVDTIPAFGRAQLAAQ